MSRPDPNAPYRERIVAAKRLLKAQIPDLAERYARLTASVEAQLEVIEGERARGQASVPEVSFADLEAIDDATRARIRQRGCVIVRGVFDRARVARWNGELEDYLARNRYI